jgi:hypothetical protein
MTALKLFISHSSRLDALENSNAPEQNPNLKLLLDVINDIKFEYGDYIEVLVDKDEQGLPAGHDWEKRLNEWLAECHAAIILFSERALKNSNWVKKEAAILSWRREHDPNFLLIPVLLNNQISIDDLEKDLFGTLRITKNQCVRDAKNSAEIIKGIKNALGEKEFLENKCRKTPFDKLERVITTLLCNSADSETLEDVWDQLEDLDKPKWHPKSDVKFAHALTRYLIRDHGKCLHCFETVVNHIRPKVLKENAREILEYIRPLWVDVKAAGCLPQAITHKKFLAQNGNQLQTFTFQRYSERAWPMDNCYKLVTTTTTDELTLLQEIRDKFKESKRSSPLTPEDCDQKINNYPRQILILLLASEQEGGGILEDLRLRTTLRQKYPKVIFVLATGEQLPSALAEDILKVEPVLDLQTEMNQMNAEDNTEVFLADFYRN